MDQADFIIINGILIRLDEIMLLYKDRNEPMALFIEIKTRPAQVRTGFASSQDRDNTYNGILKVLQNRTIRAVDKIDDKNL